MELNAECRFESQTMRTRSRPTVGVAGRRLERRFESQTMRTRSRPTVGVAGVSEAWQIDLYALSKELPTYFLLETPSGYGLVLTHGLDSIVDTDYVSVEKFINQYDENFKFIAFHYFKSTAEAFDEFQSITKGDVTNLLENFVVQNIPKVAYANGKPLFVLAVADAMMAPPMFYKTRCFCQSGVFHNDILRGVRENIRKSIKPTVLWEKEQRDLVRLYNQHAKAQLERAT